MKKILAFAATNSKNSINKQLVTYASGLIENVQVTILDLNDFDLPIYSGHYEEAHGVPSNALKFLEHLKSADGILISLAENNGAYTAVFKNLFDWMSRAEAKLFYNKPVLLMGTSPGGRGAMSVLKMAEERFPIHNAHITAVFSLPFFEKNFADGKVTNVELDKELKNKVEQFKQKL